MGKVAFVFPGRVTSIPEWEGSYMKSIRRPVGYLTFAIPSVRERPGPSLLCQPEPVPDAGFFTGGAAQQNRGRVCPLPASR